MKLPFSGRGHIKIIKEIAYGLNKAGFLNRYLELGVRQGNCFNVIAPLSKEAYAVDIKNCYKKIKANRNLIWNYMSTNEFLKNHNPERKFDLVFIDAEHSHKGSLSDFKLVFPLVNENGIILLHDTYPANKQLTEPGYCSDSYKTALYIKRNFNKECEIVTLPFYYGISIVRKISLNKQILWL
ncbi:MAG: class I SAM-dependent methyltransferase [Promethearchaeota archaeon]